MKIIIFGDCINRDTGFGSQTKFIADAFHDLGHTVIVAGAGNSGKGEAQYQQHNIPYHFIEPVDQIIEIESPDVCIFFSYLENLLDWGKSRLIGSKVPAYFWLPWEADGFRPHHEGGAIITSSFPSRSIVHLTNYAKKLWGHGDSVIPHGVDVDVFKPYKNKKKLRREMSKKHGLYLDENAIIVLNVDRNDLRKRWDLTHDYIRRLEDKCSKRVQLIAHTSIRETGGYDQSSLGEAYGTTSYVQCTAQNRNQNKNVLTQEDYASLFALSDFRISTSLGEGFGIPTIEAYASGCVNIVPDNTCYPEVAEGFTVPSNTRAVSMGLLWDFPNIQGMVDRTMEYIENPSLYKEAQEVGLFRAKSIYSKDEVASKWQALLKNLPECSVIKYPYGYRQKDMLNDMTDVMDMALKHCEADITTVINNNLLAAELRVRSHRLRSYESRNNFAVEADALCIETPNFSEVKCGKVTVLIDCIRNLEWGSFIDLLGKITSSKHLIIRFDELEESDRELLDIGDVMAHLTSAGFENNDWMETKILENISKDSELKTILNIHVWSRK